MKIKQFIQKLLNKNLAKPQPEPLSAYDQLFLNYSDLRTILKPFHLSWFGVLAIYSGLKKDWSHKLRSMHRANPRSRYIPHKVVTDYLDPMGYTRTNLEKLLGVYVPEQKPKPQEKEETVPPLPAVEKSTGFLYPMAEPKPIEENHPPILAVDYLSPSTKAKLEEYYNQNLKPQEEQKKRGRPRKENKQP